MFTIVLELLGKYWKPLSVAIILLGLVWSAYGKGHETAVTEIKVEQLETIKEIKDEQQKAAANAPRTRAAVIDSLLDGSF